MKRRKQPLGIPPPLPTNMKRCEHTGVSCGAGKVGMICRLVREEHTWDEFVCLKCSTHLLRWYVVRVPAMYTLTHAHTQASASTVLITSAVSKTRCGSRPQHCRCTLIATSCIASSLLPPHGAACFDDLSTHHKAQRALASHQLALQSCSLPRPDVVGPALPTPTAAKVSNSS